MILLSLIHIFSLIEEASYRKELHEVIRQHYLYTGSKLARTMLDNWNRYVDEFIQVVPIEYKRVLQEDQMRKLQQKIADVQRDYSVSYTHLDVYKRQALMRPRIQSLIQSGCSNISFNMKCGYPPFST